MTDRELLTLAAKAARVCLHPADKLMHSYGNWGCDTTCTVCNEDPSDARWRPLTDDGDEARLEAALNLWVQWYPAMVLVGPEVCGPSTGSAYAEYFDQHGGDKQKARRVAGVRAAAEIGKAMP